MGKHLVYALVFSLSLGVFHGKANAFTPQPIEITTPSVQAALYLEVAKKRKMTRKSRRYKRSKFKYKRFRRNRR